MVKKKRCLDRKAQDKADGFVLPDITGINDRLIQ
jgi:hypothetical protein